MNVSYWNTNSKAMIIPKIGTDSIKAAPINIVERNCPAISGWRAIDSKVLEMTKPLPIPAPQAAPIPAKPAAIKFMIKFLLLNT